MIYGGFLGAVIVRRCAGAALTLRWQPCRCHAHMVGVGLRWGCACAVGALLVLRRCLAALVPVLAPGKMHELVASGSQNVRNVPTAAVFSGVHGAKMDKILKYVE